MINRYKYEPYYKPDNQEAYKTYLSQYEPNINGEWLEIPFTWYSDYSGCLVERSNYNCILEDYNEYIMADLMRAVYGGYGTSGLIVRSILLDTDSTLIDLFNELNDYPLYNDDDYNQLEFDAIQEALDDYGYNEISSKLDIDIDNLDVKAINNLVWNGLYTVETGGLVWIDTDRVAELYAAEFTIA